MLLFVHPIIWLYQKALIAQHSGQDPTGWILIAVFVLPIWVMGLRFLAEVPGTKHGRMHMWWMIFVVFHVWGFLFYYFVDKFSEGYIFKMRTVRRIELAERSPEDILASPFGIPDSFIPTSQELTDLPHPAVYYASPLSSEGQFDHDPDSEKE